MAKSEHPQASIDWTSAAVSGGDLTVELTGDANADWAKRVQAILDRLERPGAGEWGATKVGKAKVEVAAVTAGAEDDLRHLLDSAVQQANADFAPPEEDAGDGPSEADAEMTEAFRSFAPDAAPDNGERQGA